MAAPEIQIGLMQEAILTCCEANAKSSPHPLSSVVSRLRTIEGRERETRGERGRMDRERMKYKGVKKCENLPRKLQNHHEPRKGAPR